MSKSSMMRLTWLLLATSAIGCASADPKSEGLASTAEPLTAITCASTSSHQCWDFHNNAQSSTVFEVQMRSVGPTWAYVPYFKSDEVYITSPGTPVGFIDHSDGTIPGGAIRSLSIYGAAGQDHLLILSSDSVVRVYAGDMTQAPAVGSFDKMVASYQPQTTTGGTITISQIATVYLPNIYAVSPQTIALASGKLYWLQANKWAPSSTHPGFAGLPSRTWSSISVNRGAGSGGTFVSNTGEIWRAMSGTMARDGTVTYTNAIMAKPLTVGGQAVGIVSVNGHFVITDAGKPYNCVGSNSGGSCAGDGDRIYAYDWASGTWSHFFNGNLPWYPGPSDLGTCYWTSSQNNQSSQACDPLKALPYPCTSSCYASYPYFNRIVDEGAGPALHNVFSWIHPFRP